MKRILSYLFSFFIISSLTVFSQNVDWEFLGLQNEIIFDIAIDDSGNIYVAGENVVISKSSDNGATWEPKINGLTTSTGVSLDIDSQGSIYLAALGGVFKTTNGGESWFRIAQNLSDLEFIEIKVISNDYVFVSNFDGIHRSTDRGQTWVTTDYTLFGAMEIGINSNGVMFAGNITASNFSIFRSTNLGENWNLSAWLPSIAFLFPDNGDVYAGVGKSQFNPGGIFKSTDDGITWNRTNAFPDTFFITYRDLELDRNGDFYLAISGSPLYSGVHISIDAGVSWSNYGFSLPTKSIAIDSSGYIFAGTNQQGIFRTPGRTVPVELISFTAEVSNKNVMLSWITATETNNYGFEIERKQSGIDWTKICFIQGNGTTIKENIYNYSDENIETGEYYYRLKQIDYDGSFEYSPEVQIKIEVIYDFNLEQNYPNPFNPGTIIKFSTLRNAFVTLTVYNSLGEKLKTLVNDYLPQGQHSVELKLEELSLISSSGVYFYRLQVDGYSETKKMLFLR